METETPTTELAQPIPDVGSALAAIDPSASVDALALLLMKLDIAKRTIREWEQQAESAVLEWIAANGEFTVGDIRYYAGVRKVQKPRSVQAALEAVLELTGGDVAALCEHLASDALKPGACRKTLGNMRYAELFETREVPDLAKGKPVKRLQKVDTRFIK